MNPKRRKILLALLGVVVGAWVVNWTCERFYFLPRETGERTASRLEKQLSDVRLKIRRLENRRDTLADIENSSLPADIEVASSLYQAWLLNLVTSLGISNPNVDSVSPLVEEEITRLQFNVRGKASLRLITRFLFQFYQSGNLHKIRSLSLTPTGGSEQLDVQISVEALAFRRSTNEKSLTSAASERLVSGNVEDYQAIARRNLFGEGMFSRTIRDTRLTAITSDRTGVREAWFFVARDSETHYLRAGDTLMLDSVEVRMIDIRKDMVTIEIDSQPGQITVGKSLAEFMPLD
jgi:hypothetical protein